MTSSTRRLLAAAAVLLASAVCVQARSETGDTGGPGAPGPARAAGAASPLADEVPVQPEGKDRPAHPRHADHGHHAASAAAVLDDRIKLLTAELDLDTKQQAGVRRVLLDQRIQTIKVWQDESVAAPLRIKATQDIATRTEDRIRALLNDEQRRKYIQPTPGNAGKGDGSDVETWLSRMHGK